MVAHGSSLCFVFPPQSPPQSSNPSPAPTREPQYATPDPYLRPVIGEFVPQNVWDRLGGLEILTAILAGELPTPPSRYLTGLRLVDAASGQATFALPATEWLCPPTAKVEGGVIGMLADAALGAAIMTITPARTAMASVDLKVNFLRPGIADGRELLARGKVAHAGRTIAVAHSEVVNADGKQVALATGSAVLLPGQSASLSDLKLD
ncbi:MAG: PaaI family thioesterase [Candidatus Binatia bacterium]